jgi:hypothetical protein
MQTLPRNVNPFALMLDPQAVIAQIERSERLEGLHRRVCRPLDKPLLGGTVDDSGEGDGGSAAAAGTSGDDDSGQATDGAPVVAFADSPFNGAKHDD